MTPELAVRVEEGLEVPLLVWRFAEPHLTISSGPLGGGIGIRHWLMNASVPLGYSRLDPEAHLRELSSARDLAGSGVGMLTGVDVRDVVHAHDDGVTVHATVGIGAPAWAAAPDGHLRTLRTPVAASPPKPGTINIVIELPVAMAHAALVNAVGTATEAKTQALWDAGINATGTATDAVAIWCPVAGPLESFGGPRSTWGARLARATHEAVLRGAQEWLRTGRSWSSKLGIADPPLGAHVTESST